MKLHFSGVVLLGLAAAFAVTPASAQFIPAEITAGINATSMAVISGVSRPTDPFVVGLAAESDGDCSAGVWSRGTGGYINLNTGGTTVDVRYVGAVAGADYTCKDVNGSGIDVTGGVEVSKLFGRGANPATPTQYADLDQTSLGGYIVAAAKSGLNVVVGLKRELNTLTAHGFPPALIPEGSTLAVNRTVLNATASYSIPVGTDMGIVPDAGLSVFNTDSASVALGTPGFVANLNGGIGAIAFVGVSVNKQISLSDTSALVPFASAHFYADLGSGISGTLTFNGAPVGTQALNGPGNFGEVSAGAIFVKLLEGSAAKQFTGSVRGDVRFNGSFKAFVGTVQARWQF